jgi:SAM-dependent methyltransferase
MDEKYWDRMAADYDGEIFSVLASDRNEVIVSVIQQFGSREAVACDFGCGVGKFLQVLAENFRTVYALDLSGKLLEQAHRDCKSLRNISFSKTDLSKNKLKLPRVDFGLCVNVLIMPSRKIRIAVFDTITKHLRSGSHLVLVVPSLESALLSDYRLVQWNLKEGYSHEEAVSDFDNDTDASVRQGLVEIDGVPTKHYPKEELIAFLKDKPFEIVSIEKVEYSWDTEFDSPPKWMQEPYPWDWLLVLKKS